MIDFNTPRIINVDMSDVIGNTLVAAATHAFNLKDQEQVKYNTDVVNMISILVGTKWIDFDFWMTDKGFAFLLAH